MAGDPTQHLLTALGRFQRQVAKGETGAPQETWSDECMGQLIRGIEVAHAQGWSDVQEALTDTARILQTYEDADAASACVPFLQDSYEILCLMVGDLIVDNVRSGVMQKWRERYRRAEADLETAGYALISDDDQEDAEAPAAWREETVFESMEEELASGSEDAVQPVAQAAYREMEAELPAMPEDDVPVLADSADAADEAAAMAPATKEPVEEEIIPFEMPYDAGLEASPADNLPSLDELIAGQGSAAAVEEEAGAGLGAEEAADLTAESGGTADVEPETPERIEEPAVEDQAFEALTFPDEGIEEAPSSPAGDHAGDLSFGHAQEPAEDMDAGLPMAERQAAAAQASAEAEEAPAGFDTSDAAEQSAESEADSLKRTSEELFQTTQAAILRGDVAGAKIMALRLAANMAKLEQQHAERALAQAEARLIEDGDAITAAQEDVRRTEKSVQDVEWLVGEREAEFQKGRENAAALHEQRATVEGAIAELDRQIADLQTQREAEACRMAEIQAELEGATSAESRIQTELDDLGASGESARGALEEARRKVERLEQQCRAREAELANARERLEQQHKATADIEQTISAITACSRPPSNEGEPLL